MNLESVCRGARREGYKEILLKRDIRRRRLEGEKSVISTWIGVFVGYWVITRS